jgi:DNA ligase 1
MGGDGGVRVYFSKIKQCAKRIKSPRLLAFVYSSIHVYVCMMKRFAELFTELDQTTKTLVKIRALQSYFAQVPDNDKVWAIALLSHRRPKRTVNTTLMSQWATERSQLPGWLFHESHGVVGDLAETITLVLPPPRHTSGFSLSYWIGFIRDLEPLSVEQKRDQILWAWDRLDQMERFVFNKLITGAFRIGVSQKLMVKALAKHTGVAETSVAHKLMGNWDPQTASFHELLFTEEQTDISKPYPFYLAYALEGAVEDLGNPSDWYAERKWDGIRGQVIVRNGELFVWSRGEELVTDKYPEYTMMKDMLPDGTVLDGEIMPYKDGAPLSFNHLQTRIGRKTLSPKLLRDVPVTFIAYDVLEWLGEDIRHKPMNERRQILEKICEAESQALRLSQLVPFTSWEELSYERSRSREFLSEGIM